MGANFVARRSNRSLSFLAVIPAIIGVLVGAISSIANLYVTGSDFLKRDDILKIRDLLANPISAAAAAVYGSVILAIITIILYLVVRSARTADSLERRLEPPSELPGEQPEPAPISPEERAKRERDRHLSSIRITFSRNRRRMIEESERLQRNGYLNLMIGILFSVIALGILGYPLFNPNSVQVTDWISFLDHFAPRLSVGLLIQLIGFFFLRLYVAGENEVHYIRNEITNLESRLIGYHIASVAKQTVAMTDLVKQLARTERNFKLKKGERALYSADETFNDVRELVKDVAEVVPARLRKNEK